MDTKPDLHSRAAALRRRLLGDRRADEIAAGTDAFNQPFQDYATTNVFGGTWLNGVVSERELALVNIGMLAGAGRFEEAAVYVGTALRVGVSLREVRELVMHITVYCGTPVGRQLLKAARKSLLEDGFDIERLLDADAPASTAAAARDQ
ncbi:4-carboxymuconolactone decarboxylase [soil metagenome]